MSAKPIKERAHFLDKPEDETADGFLKRRLSFIEDEFSEEELSGLPPEALREQRGVYNAIMRITFGRFAREEFMFSEDLELYENIIGEEVDLYEPLTTEQKNEIYFTRKRVKKNFEKAYAEARERKYDRITKVIHAIPIPKLNP
jgi:hypothetical protein